jgi:hypothetical protein
MTEGRMQSLASQIEGIQAWIDQNREQYRTLKKAFDDAAVLRKALTEDVPAAVVDILGYDPVQHRPEVAVAACAAAKVRLEHIFSGMHFIEVYEEKVEVLGNLMGYNQAKQPGPDAPDQQMATDA